MKPKVTYMHNPRNARKPHIRLLTLPDPTKAKGYREEREAYETQADAYRAIFGTQRDIDAGLLDTKPVTFGEAAYHWLEYRKRSDKYKPITLDRYRQMIGNQLTPYLDKPLKEVAEDASGVHEFLCSKKSGTSLRTIMRGTCDLAVHEGRIIFHRLGFLDIPDPPKNVAPLIPYTPEQFEIIMGGIPDHWKLAPLLGRGCGLRIGEAMALETDALHGGYLEVMRGSLPGFDGLPKHRRAGFVPRVVPIPFWLEPMITEHVEKHAKDGVLFPSRPGSKCRYASYNGFTDNFWRPAVKRAGLPTEFPRAQKRFNFTTHQMRHHWATQMRAESMSLGVSDGDVEQWIGHSNLTRDVYAVQSPETIKRGRYLSDPRNVALAIPSNT